VSSRNTLLPAPWGRSRPRARSPRLPARVSTRANVFSRCETQRVRALVLVAALAAALAASAGAAPTAKLAFADVVRPGKSLSLSLETRQATAFRVVLRVPTRGRAQLFLGGRRAPRGGPLIDTRTYRCKRAAGTAYCSAAYEPLPKGLYRWRVRWLGDEPARVALTVRW